jgi:hypothetical protein
VAQTVDTGEHTRGADCVETGEHMHGTDCADAGEHTRGEEILKEMCHYRCGLKNCDI